VGKRVLWRDHSEPFNTDDGMMIRRATVQDIPAIIEIAVVSVSQNPLPVRIDRGAMRDTIKATIAPNHFCWVSEHEGKVVAAIVACTQPSFWFERQSCSVLLYYTTVPGKGIDLIREFARWVKSRPAIKLATFELEPEVDPRLVKLLARLGFNRQSQNMTYVRGRVYE
jgi:hypothetical protein